MPYSWFIACGPSVTQAFSTISPRDFTPVIKHGGWVRNEISLRILRRQFPDTIVPLNRAGRPCANLCPSSTPSVTTPPAS